MGRLTYSNNDINTLKAGVIFQLLRCHHCWHAMGFCDPSVDHINISWSQSSTSVYCLWQATTITRHCAMLLGSKIGEVTCADFAIPVQCLAYGHVLRRASSSWKLWRFLREMWDFRSYTYSSSLPLWWFFLDQHYLYVTRSDTWM